MKVKGKSKNTATNAMEAVKDCMMGRLAGNVEEPVVGMSAVRLAGEMAGWIPWTISITLRRRLSLR